MLKSFFKMSERDYLQDSPSLDGWILKSLGKVAQTCINPIQHTLWHS